MARNGGTHGDSRASALWGTGNRGGEGRSSALWGKSGRGIVALCGLVALLVAPMSGFASGSSDGNQFKAFVPKNLLDKAQQNPDMTFQVIVQGTKGQPSADVASDVSLGGGNVKRSYLSINGTSVSISGKDLLKLARYPKVESITPDYSLSGQDYQSQEMWRATTGVDKLWSQPAVTCAKNALTGLQLDPTCVAKAAVVAPQAPAIAIVDSGIDASRVADFGSRVVASVNLSSLAPGATGDDEGHGTMVAGLAAGAASLHPGVAQNAPLVDLRTADANGQSRVSDVIAAADWILQHKSQYNIRVANFSLRGAVPSSFRYDPLDKAVERLWFSGVTVVVAGGNYGTGGQETVQFSPANDPFVIAVGALDTRGTTTPSDDFTPAWSVHGHTLDGFAKPDISAPGRWIVAPVPVNASLPLTAPDRVVAPGYMWMSGTSLAAPMVAGAAAQLLARHPEWTPDQVKGALMRSASALPNNPGFAGGVGELNAARAAAVSNPPNPNKNLYRFVVSDPATGAQSFDGNSWMSFLKLNPGWSQADWSQVDWSQVDWSQVDWNQVDWSQIDWSQVDWNQVDWSQVDWSQVDWSQVDWSE